MREPLGFRELLTRAQAGEKSVMERLLVEVRPSLEACCRDVYY